jgi:hypothetical protein
VNVIFLSPQFPPQFHLFCRALKEEGATVLGLADVPFEALAPELREVLTSYYCVTDMSRYDDVLRGVAFFIHRHGRIHRIDSLNEHWLELEARLREDFNIPGQRPSDTARNRSKSSMREIFRQAGVPCSEGERLTSRDHAWALAARFGYPLVLKPDVGVGAAKTFRVESDAQLAEALEQPLEGYVVERFETGRLVSFDGLTDRSGRVVFATSHVFSSGIMEIVNRGMTMHYYSRREIPPLLEELGRKTLAAFSVRERFFHIEFFETDDGGYRALEINVRPPGGFTTDMMNFSADIDIYRLWAKVLCGRDVSHFRYDRKYFCAYVGRRDGVRYALSAEEVLSYLHDTRSAHGNMPAVLAGALGNQYFIFRDRELEPLLTAIAELEETI